MLRASEHIPEKDWKYLRSVEKELLDTLCRRINEEASRIIGDSSLSQYEKFSRLLDHVMEKNKHVADCFDDWRRSNIFLKLLVLLKHELLTDQQVLKLSEETQAQIGFLKGLLDI